MEGFLDFMTPRHKFSAVVYDKETQFNLTNYCLDMGLNLDVGFDGEPLTEPFEFHTTIFMGKKARFLPNTEMTWIGEVYATGFDLLGEKLDIPVILVDGRDIQNVRRHFQAEMGEEDKTYPIFKPHISLSYSRDFFRNEDGVFPNGLANIPVPSFPLKFEKVVIRDAS